MDSVFVQGGTPVAVNADNADIPFVGLSQQSLPIDLVAERILLTWRVSTPTPDVGRNQNMAANLNANGSVEKSPNHFISLECPVLCGLLKPCDEPSSHLAEF